MGKFEPSSSIPVGATGVNELNRKINTFIFFIIFEIKSVAEIWIEPYHFFKSSSTLNRFHGLMLPCVSLVFVGMLKIIGVIRLIIYIFANQKHGLLPYNPNYKHKNWSKNIAASFVFLKKPFLGRMLLIDYLVILFF